MTIDLDALEKLADEAMLPMSVKTMRMHKKAVREFRIFANPWKIKALIAELKEAQRLMKPFAVYYEINDLDERAADDAIEVPVGDLRLVRAFLARNGKGEG
ncbi:hypothetical protein [Brevundimonas sp.]|uniref:hypothetical protein n=1 Tax=Brevundimonas sp. TaxID=1871086 RepID=UPI0028AA0B86|nr:hypothetical protein [Brevundimonas sp.]